MINPNSQLLSLYRFSLSPQLQYNSYKFTGTQTQTEKTHTHDVTNNVPTTTPLQRFQQNFAKHNITRRPSLNRPCLNAYSPNVVSRETWLPPWQLTWRAAPSRPRPPGWWSDSAWTEDSTVEAAQSRVYHLLEPAIFGRLKDNKRWKKIVLYSALRESFHENWLWNFNE